MPTSTERTTVILEALSAPDVPRQAERTYQALGNTVGPKVYDLNAMLAALTEGERNELRQMLAARAFRNLPYV